MEKTKLEELSALLSELVVAENDESFNASVQPVTDRIEELLKEDGGEATPEAPEATPETPATDE